jgi:N-acetyl-gamma-glutamyl-phosphate reductase
MIRGIHATLYAKICIDDLPDIQSLYESHYQQEAFVDVLPEGSHPETRSVRGSNICRIALHRSGQRLIVLSVIDNLVKGAAGQAVQNMNLMCGYDEQTGLTVVPLAP